MGSILYLKTLMFERTVSGNRGRILSRSHARISDAGHPPSFVSLTGLKNRGYDLVILHSLPADKSLYCQRYMDEQIYLTVEENHPAANKKSISFAEMRGIRILVSGSIGFWMDICKIHLAEEDLLIQRSPEALGELIEASTLPFFNSDRMIEMGYQSPGRVDIPISDEDAHATYWVVCRDSDQSKYRAIFNAVRGYALRH